MAALNALNPAVAVVLADLRNEIQVDDKAFARIRECDAIIDDCAEKLVQAVTDSGRCNDYNVGRMIESLNVMKTLKSTVKQAVVQPCYNKRPHAEVKN